MDWYKATDWSALGKVSQKPAAHSACDLNKDQASGLKFQANHYQDPTSLLKTLGDSLTFDAIEQLISDLMTAIPKEGTAWTVSSTRFVSQLSGFAWLFIEQILQRAAVIQTDSLVEPAGCG
jgi:hypothetical protein